MDEELREFLEIFREESLERMVNVSRSLDELGHEGGDREAALEEVDRELHTIKGSARLLGFEELGKLVHEIESVARRYRDQGDVPRELLVEAADRLTDMIEQAAHTGEEPDPGNLPQLLAQALAGEAAAPASPPAPPPAPERPPEPLGKVGDDPAAMALATTPAPPAPEPRSPATASSRVIDESRPSRRYGEDEHVRVKVSRLQDLDGIVTALSLSHLRLQSHEAELRRLHQAVDLGEISPASVSETLRRVLQSFTGPTAQVRRSARTLQQLAVDVRLRPVEALFDHIPREARDVARRLGKQVRVRLYGGETEIDRLILQRLKSPLSHLIRNAIDHGLESPNTRVAHGKDPIGLLDVSASHDGGMVVIRIHDDGAGIDHQRIRARAVERGLLDEAGAQTLTDQEALQLIMVAGFSTRETASEISGRGVGMDVVLQTVESMGGDLRVTSEPGQSTTITIRLPLTQLISRVTFVRSQGQQFALPTESLVESLLVPRGQVTSFAEREALIYEGRSVPLVRLSGLLGHRLLPDSHQLSVLLLRHGDDQLALVIEELLEERSVVVKPLGWPLERLPTLGGAIHLPTGEIAFLLHVPDLFALLRAGRVHARPASTDDRRTILVVDDSIVSRQMVSRYVEAMGFELITAVDGLDAWAILERGVQPDLIVSDVEMPRLNGLGLARRIRSHERLAPVPVVIVSTRGSDADRQAGLEAGADAYLTKGELNEKAFRRLIERLL